jgi:hypothetical protein
VADAPVGTQAATFDVDAAFRNVPLHPSVRPFLAVKVRDRVHIDLCGNFGAASMPGIWGHIADAMVRILMHRGVEALLKWVDDFIFLRYPKCDIDGNPFFPHQYSYDDSLIWKAAEELGWPWAPSKFLPFAEIFKYIGFIWDLVRKVVYLPDDKRIKYLGKLESWSVGSSHMCSEVNSVVGTLNHVCLIVPEGRSHMTSLFRFAAGFEEDCAPYISHRISARVLEDIGWWQEKLSHDYVGMDVIRPPEPQEDFKLYVDASTSWGIGLVLNGR